MGLFGRSNKPPRWARPLGSKERFERFVEVAVETLGDRGVKEWQVRSGSILLDEVEIALDEAVERCAEVDEDRWPEVLGGLVDDADSDVAHNLEPELLSEHSIAAGGRIIDLVSGDFADIAPFLRIQIFSPESRGAFEAADTSRMITRSIGDDLTAVLVFDFGSFEQTVDSQHALGWGPPEQEIWAVALENLAADPIAAERLETPGGDILLLAGNGNFVSSLVTRWRDGLDLETPDGALIALPTWHALLIHPVDPEITAAVIEPMTALVSQMVADLEDPVSSSIYWEPAAGERLQRVEVDGDLTIIAPDALVALLG